MRRSTGERRRSSRIPPTRRNPSYAPSRPTHRGSAASKMNLIPAKANPSAWGRTSQKTQLRRRSVQSSRHRLANDVPCSASPRNFRILRELWPFSASDGSDDCHLAQQWCRKSRRQDTDHNSPAMTAEYGGKVSNHANSGRSSSPSDCRLMFRHCELICGRRCRRCSNNSKRTN